MSDQDDVRKASSNFYAALSRMCGGEKGSMAAIWSHGPDVTALHPLGGRAVGWEAVGGSFDQAAAISTGGKVAIEEQLIRVHGNLAFEVGVERGRAVMDGQQITIDQRVTNIYAREAGKWLMMHHHSDISPAMTEMAAGLQG